MCEHGDERNASGIDREFLFFPADEEDGKKRESPIDCWFSAGVREAKKNN